MKRVAGVLGLATALCGGPGFALEIDPQARQKAVAASVASAPAVAPAPTHNPLPDLPNGVDLNARGALGDCANATTLCYDSRERRLVYRPTRNWMPEITGLRAEHISVRRDSVVFKYSFR